MVPTLPCGCPACRQWVPSRLLRPPAVCPSPGRPGLAPAEARPPALAPPVNAPPPSPHAARPSRRRSLHSSLASVFSQCVRGPFSLAAVSGCHCPCVGRPPAFLGGARSRLCPRCLCVPGTPPVCSGSQSALRAGPSVSGLFPLRLSPSSASGTQAASARPSPSTSCPCLRHSTVAALWTGCWVMAACWQGHCPSLLCPGQCHRARLMWGSRLTPRRCSPRPHPLCLFRAPGSAAYLEFITSLHSVKLSAATSRCVQAPCLQPRLRDLTSG